MMSGTEKAFYMAHSMLPSFNKKVSNARECVSDMLNVAPNSVLSLSFGKDSVVMCDVVLRDNADIEVVYVNCGDFDEFPDTPQLKRSLESKWQREIIELEGKSIIEFYRRIGHVTVQEYTHRSGDEYYTSEIRKSIRELNNVLNDAVCGYMEENGNEGVFLGLRKQESFYRAILISKRGPLYFAKKRDAWTCCPLWNWSARDIWAYIVKHGLPYHDLYDNDPAGRERARKAALIGSTCERYGRFSSLRKMYPDVWNKLLVEFPELSMRE